jgi:hypothetical protein
MLKDTDKRREKKVLAGAKLMREKKSFPQSHKPNMEIHILNDQIFS